jgi:hypothetical protein
MTRVLSTLALSAFLTLAPQAQTGKKVFIPAVTVRIL